MSCLEKWGSRLLCLGCCACHTALNKAGRAANGLIELSDTGICLQHRGSLLENNVWKMYSYLESAADHDCFRVTGVYCYRLTVENVTNTLVNKYEHAEKRPFRKHANVCFDLFPLALLDVLQL